MRAKAGKGHAMILAEKIMKLRKQNGLSQEELAVQLNVSRQSVSKWESGTSVPDLNKIIKLSEIFGVSTDYLLKDEIEDERSEYVESKNEYDYDQNIKRRKVTLEEATEYMDSAKKSSAKIAAGVVLCILSPVPLVLLAAVGEMLSKASHAAGNAGHAMAEEISENMVGGIGVTVMLIMIAVAVGIFISNGIKMSKYEYLEKEPIAPEYGVASLAESRKEKFQRRYKNSMTAGICLCILCVMPIILGGVFNGSDFIMACLIGVLFIMIATGVFFIVNAGIIWQSFQKLLEEGDFSNEKKRAKKVYENIYWPIVTAAYLAISFATWRWNITWIIWPVAALLSGVLDAVFKNRYDQKHKN